MSEKKLDIFRTLEAIDRKDREFFKNLTEEEQKAFAPVVVMRWLSTVSDKSGLSEYYTLMVNEMVNVGFWDLYKHPGLQYLLMTLVGPGKKVAHQWVPMVKREKRAKVVDLLRKRYPSANDEEIDILIYTNTPDDIRDLCISYGYDDKYIKEVVGEFKKLKK